MAAVSCALTAQHAGLLHAGDCIIDCSCPPLEPSSSAADPCGVGHAQAQIVQLPVPAFKQDKQGLVRQLPSMLKTARAALLREGRVVVCDRSGESVDQLV